MFIPSAAVLIVFLFCACKDRETKKNKTNIFFTYFLLHCITIRYNVKFNISLIRCKCVKMLKFFITIYSSINYTNNLFNTLNIKYLQRYCK